MTTQAIQEFLDQTDIDGALDPQQAAALLALAEQGDTGAGKPVPDNGSAPSAAPAAQATPEVPAANLAPQPDGEKTPVLLAKDGVHTIDYQKLVDARQGEQHWKAQAEALQAANAAAELELNSLRAAAQARADAGVAPTQVDNMVKAADAAMAAGVDISVFGNFSEEEMARGIQHTVAKEVERAVAAKVDEAVKPFKDRHEQSLRAQEAQADADHKTAVLTAHPDAVSIYQSQELQTWIGAKPNYEQAAIRGVLEGGEAPDLIAVFDRYKQETGAKPAPAVPAATDAKAAAKAAIETAQQNAIPPSLSAIPGGRTGGTSVHDQMGAMDPTSLSAAMQGMNPAQIEAFLNRQI